MAQDPKKRQKSIERRTARQKQRKALMRRQQQAASSQRSHVAAEIRDAASWPLHEVLISRNWQDSTGLTQILVARRSPIGEIAIGAFLVDLACLGVKNAVARRFASRTEYEREFRDSFVSSEPMSHGDLNLAARIIREGLAYAAGLGLKPDPAYYAARLILGDADPDASPVKIPTGRDGKPFYVAGPYDDSAQIMATLTRKLGPDGFDYLVPISPMPADFWDDDPDEGDGAVEFDVVELDDTGEPGQLGPGGGQSA